jgi:hypothetical protein
VPPAVSEAEIGTLAAVPTVPVWSPGLVTVTEPPPPLPNCTSSTECSSMPLGATPVWPCRKSKKPTPVTVTGTLAVLNELVRVYLAVNSVRDL